MRSQRFRALLVGSVALLTVSVILPAPAAANLLPEATIVTHVQTPDPDNPCAASAITDCYAISQSTTAEGDLEFDLFVGTPAHESEHLPIYSMETFIHWPSNWHFVDFNVCNGGWGGLELMPGGFRLYTQWSQCPPIAGELFLAARLVLHVSGPGRLEFPSGSVVSTLRLNCGADQFTAYPVCLPAEAGMDCEWTPNTCGGSDDYKCIAQFASPLLEITVPLGSSAQGTMDVTALGPAPCDFVASGMDPWLSGTCVNTEYPHYLLTVTADASGLSEGIHESRVRVASDLMGTTRCLPVRVTVTSIASVPEPDPSLPADPDPRIVQSWGQIKSAYRR